MGRVSLDLSSPHDDKPSATSAGAYRRIQMWAYPLRKAKKTNKAKIPYDNHAKPLRKNKNKKTTIFRSIQLGA